MTPNKTRKEEIHIDAALVRRLLAARTPRRAARRGSPAASVAILAAEVSAAEPDRRSTRTPTTVRPAAVSYLSYVSVPFATRDPR